MPGDVSGFKDLLVGRRLATARVLDTGAVATAVEATADDATVKPWTRLDVLTHLGPLLFEIQPVERSAVTVPISPTGTFTDTVLYVDPTDPTRRYWLPRYRLRDQNGNKEIGHEEADGLWLVRFGLETFPAPELPAEAATAQVLPHTVTMVVTSGANVTRTYTVAELAPDPRGWVLTLRLTLDERDALLRAFMSDEERATIEVRRQITVAAPVVPTPPADDGPLVGPLQPGGGESTVLLPVIDPRILMAPIFVPIEVVEPPDGPPAPPDDQPIVDVTTAVAITPEVQLLEVARPMSEVRMTRLEVNPDLIAVQPRAASFGFKRALAARRVSDVFDPFGDLTGVPVVEGIPTPQQPQPSPELFTTTTTAVSDWIPLRFDPDTQPLIFPSGGAASVASEYELVTLPWEGDGPGSPPHVYAQDVAAPWVFHYLPDTFLVGTLAQAPRGPELVFSVGRSQQDPTESIGVISAHLVPQTSGERLSDAQQRLADHIPIGQGAQRTPRLEPMLARATGTVRLPGGADAIEADVDLVNGWWVTGSFPYDDLQEAYAVLGTPGTVSALLRGTVSLEIDDRPIGIPVEVRLERPAMPALSWGSDAGDGGALALTLRNDGPDPVVVPQPAAWVAGAEELVSAEVTGAEWPITLEPGAATELQVSLESQPDGADRDPTVALDLTGCRVTLTPEAAVERTLDRRVTQLPRAVQAFTTVDLLGATGDPARDVSVVALEFKGAAPVLLDATTMVQNVLVPVPLQDILLGRSDGTYMFRQTVVRKSGEQNADIEWRSTDSGVLAVPQQ